VMHNVNKYLLFIHISCILLNAPFTRSIGLYLHLYAAPVLLVVLLFKFICFCKNLTCANPSLVKCNLFNTKLCTTNHFSNELVFLVYNGNNLKYDTTWRSRNVLNPVAV